METIVTINWSSLSMQAQIELAGALGIGGYEFDNWPPEDMEIAAVAVECNSAGGLYIHNEPIDEAKLEGWAAEHQQQAEGGEQ